MTRKTELEAHWRSVLEDFAASNFGVGRYCQERKISKASLYGWSHRLGIPLKALMNTAQTSKKDKQGSSAKVENPFSFIELKIPSSNTNVSLPLKLELLLPQKRLLKIETTSTWEDVVGMIKALVN